MDESNYLGKSKVIFCIEDCYIFLKKIPSNSIDLICIDPPYNLNLANWDKYDNYVEWASVWINESYRVLKKDGSLVIFGGIQFRKEKSGDILDLIYYIRNNTKFNLINTIVWHYKNGISSKRFFSNRHEEIIWLSKSEKYFFNLDAVRTPYDEKNLQSALKDKRLNKNNILLGKNPTNVWELGRLNGNCKERVGHPTQKPIKVIERILRALSKPGDNVLDFFAGSGTIGRVCIAEKRNCIMCDSDKQSTEYFQRHIMQMKEHNKCSEYYEFKTVKEFFNYKEIL